jgi:predicted nucleotidyltransferase
MDNDIRELLNELKARLTQFLESRTFRLVLFGSRARGDYDKDSDIDVAIIVDGLSQELKDRVLDLVTDLELERSKPLSPLVLGQEQFDALRGRERRIALDIVEEGIVV